jgi:trimeric autotransporter adhesin
MKFFLLFSGFLLAVLAGLSQAVTITAAGTVTAPTNPNVIFSVQSGTQGIQFPMMSSTARLSMGQSSGMAPGGGLSLVGIVVFDSTAKTIYYNNGATWIPVGAATTGESWLTTGNAGTVDGANFIGTIDNIPLTFRVDNQPAGRIDPNRGTTFFGYQTGLNNAAFGNSAIGYQALFSNTSGINNNASGWSALYFNTTGSANTANGVGTLYNNATGNNNSALGYDALNMNTTGNNNTGAGYFSLGYNSNGNNNSAYGYFALGNNISGSNNVAIGAYALSTATGASGLVAVGDSALLNNSTGIRNTAMGYLAAFSNTSGSDNVAIGISALSSNTTASNLVAIGDSALFNNTQTRNTAVGSQAMFQNTTGGDNTAVGYGALENNNTGFGNSAFGSQARTGTSSSFNTVLGFNAGSVDGITDATAIGSNAQVQTSNSIQLGDNAVTAVNSFGTFNTISDGRFKFNIREDVGGLDFILRLRPVTYQLDTRKIANELGGRNAGVGGNTLASFAAANPDSRAMSIRRTGFIAQEVEKAAASTGFDFDGIKKPQNDKDHYSLSYEEFVVPLVKAVQEQQKEIKDQQKEIEEQRKEMEEQRKEIEDLKKLVVEISKKINRG